MSEERIKIRVAMQMDRPTSGMVHQDIRSRIIAFVHATKQLRNSVVRRSQSSLERVLWAIIFGGHNRHVTA